jgi:hypothetical protein
VLRDEHNPLTFFLYFVQSAVVAKLTSGEV